MRRVKFLILINLGRHQQTCKTVAAVKLKKWLLAVLHRAVRLVAVANQAK